MSGITECDEYKRLNSILELTEEKFKNGEATRGEVETAYDALDEFIGDWYNAQNIGEYLEYCCECDDCECHKW